MSMTSQQVYDEDRYVSPIPENLRCVICMNVLTDPVQCVNNEHCFCKQCITRYFREREVCPSCIEPLTVATLRPARLVRDVLSHLLIRCDNFSRGCTETPMVESLPNHVANCEFSPVKCSNNGCEVVTNRKDQTDHQRNDCDFRLTACRACGDQVCYWKRNVHCYVTKQEMEKMKKIVKESKDEMSEIKRTMANLSKEMFRFMGELKGEVGGIKDLVGGMKNEMRSIKGEVDGVKGIMGGVRGEMGGIRAEISDIRGDIGGIRGEIDNVRGEINDINGDIGDIKGQIGGLKCEVDIIKDKVGGNRGDLGAAGVVLGTQRASATNVGQFRDIIMVGGTGVNERNPQSSVEKFSWSTRQWTLLPSTTSSRSYSSCCVYKDQVIVHGGFKNDSMEAFNIIRLSDGWRKLGRLPQQMLGHSCVVYQDCLYTFGGENDREKKFNGIYKMHLVPPYSFTLIGCLPEPRVHHGAELFGDKVVIVGGTTTGHYDNYLDSVLEYNITNNTCRFLPALPYAVTEMATVPYKDNVIVIGGEDEENDPLNKVVMYNITTGRSTMLPPMKEKRSRCSAVITNNVIVVMGGLNDQGKRGSVEQFSFNLQTWEYLPPMIERRQGACSAVLM